MSPDLNPPCDGLAPLAGAESSRTRTLAELRRRLQAMAGGRHGRLALAPALDAALGGGLARGGLHEILAADEGAATGFCAALAGHLAGHLPGHLPGSRSVL